MQLVRFQSMITTITRALFSGRAAWSKYRKPIRCGAAVFRVTDSEGQLACTRESLASPSL